MSITKNATIAAVFALGVCAAMITPASAVGTATNTYTCGAPASWNSITATFTRTAPTTPATKNLTLVVNIAVPQTTPTPVGGAVAALSGPAGTPYPLTVSNPSVVPATGVWDWMDFTMTGSSPNTLTSPPDSFNFTVSNLGLNLTCTLVNAAGWPI